MNHNLNVIYIHASKYKGIKAEVVGLNQHIRNHIALENFVVCSRNKIPNFIRKWGLFTDW